MADTLSEQQRAFLEANHGAVMATVDDRGRPHAGSRTTCACTGRPPAATPDDIEEYRAAMVAERHLVDVLTPERVYPSRR
jgi:hypothetical protein